MATQWNPYGKMTYREHRESVRNVKRTSKGTPVHLLVPKKRPRKKFLGII